MVQILSFCKKLNCHKVNSYLTKNGTHWKISTQHSLWNSYSTYNAVIDDHIGGVTITSVKRDSIIRLEGVIVGRTVRQIPVLQQSPPNRTIYQNETRI